MRTQTDLFDYVVIGSGFGGSVAALRLAEKGYRVLVLERGKRWRDEDFPKTNWNLRKFLWFPRLRCFGFQQLSWLSHSLVLHGSGVGGGSLGYANVLMEPSDELFNAPNWRELADWKNLLRPFFDRVKHMLGATTNPKLWQADAVLKQIAVDRGREKMFCPTEVGVYFGEPGKTVPDPYFYGEGPERAGCQHDGACMNGCRHNAKNTLVKNYLHFAEKRGVEIRAQAEVHGIVPLSGVPADGARYEITYHSPMAWRRQAYRVRARNVVVSAGVIGTLDLLFRCRDVIGTLPRVSQRLGDMVRTNSETMLAVFHRDRRTDHSQGVAISSIFKVDDVTNVEPVRHTAGSSLMLLMDTMPLIDGGRNFLARLGKIVWMTLRHPIDAVQSRMPPVARRAIILLVMQSKDNLMRLRLQRGRFNPFRYRLVSEDDAERPVPSKIDVAHQVTREFAEKSRGIALGSLTESLLNIPTVAHLLGGCPMGVDDARGVVGLDFQVHNYPGMYVVDGSIMPANPGVNPSLTIAALAEYAMSRIPSKECDPPLPQQGVVLPSRFTSGSSIVDGYFPPTPSSFFLPREDRR